MTQLLTTGGAPSLVTVPQQNYSCIVQFQLANAVQCRGPMEPGRLPGVAEGVLFGNYLWWVVPPSSTNPVRADSSWQPYVLEDDFLL